MMPTTAPVHGLVRRLILLAALLAIPIIPFLIFGEWFEARIADWLRQGLSPVAVSAAVFGLLAGDILLPVPSSVVTTFAGRVLGFWTGTAVAWGGMTAGAVGAFGLARSFGRPLARRLSSDQELARTDALALRWGVWVLVLTRPVPVLAEASVLLMGTTRLAWSQCLLAVSLSNLGIAGVYAALGERVQFPLAVIASIALPLLLTSLAHRLWPADPPAAPRVSNVGVPDAPCQGNRSGPQGGESV